METIKTIEFTSLGFLAIGWSMSPVVFKNCPNCNQRNSIRTKDIGEENTVVCENCGTLLQLKLIKVVL